MSIDAKKDHPFEVIPLSEFQERMKGAAEAHNDRVRAARSEPGRDAPDSHPGPQMSDRSGSWNGGYRNSKVSR